ncbi:PAC2 family protein [Nanoarchaeota archaeon]
MTWKLEKKMKKLKSCILIEGLPGIGNVGKIAADLLLQELKASPAAKFSSNMLPNAVFVQEDNMIEMPVVEFQHVKHKGKDFLFLVGDVQPTEEELSYKFTKSVLDFAQDNGCNEIVTLGGIGLQMIPEVPKVYCTANNKALMQAFAKHGAKTDIYGKVGPIIGITGLLLGLGKERKIKAAALLAETLAHPMYLGLRGAKELMEVLNKRYDFGVSTDDLEKEIKENEEKMKNALSNTQQLQGQEHPEMSYIG